MKRALAVAVVLGLMAGAMVAPAEAAKKKKKKPPVPVKIERVVDLAYQCPCGPSTPVRAQGFWLGAGGQVIGGGEIPTGDEDKYVKVEATDQSGQKVFLTLGQDPEGDDTTTSFGEACGASSEAIEVPAPGTAVVIYAHNGVCSDGSTPSIATKGAVKVTFSNMP